MEKDLSVRVDVGKFNFLNWGSKSSLEEAGECQQYHNPNFPYKFSLYTNQSQVNNFEKQTFRHNVIISCTKLCRLYTSRRMVGSRSDSGFLDLTLLRMN